MLRLLSASLSATVLIATVALGLEVQTFGFPDGHVTAYEAALRTVAYGLVPVAVFFIGGFGAIGVRKKGKRTVAFFWKLLIALAVFVVTTGVLNAHLYRTLDRGQGG